jgi:hypothetical protein
MRSLNHPESRVHFPRLVHRPRPAVAARVLWYSSRSTCGAEADRDMITPLSDDAMGSPDKISPRHVFEARIRISLQRDNGRLSLQGWARNLSEVVWGHLSPKL